MGKISPSNGARKSGVKRTVRIGAHNVSVSLEDAFWDAFKEIADIQGIRRAALVSIIKSEHQGAIYRRRSGCLFSGTIAVGTRGASFDDLVGA
jgi:predicted DNA-binding ribbon-helix-helix protein